MPDWEAFVRQQLSGLALEPQECGDVIAELAAHLDETFEGLCKQGVPEEAAIQRTLSQIKDWGVLERRIQSARSKENMMTDRVRQFWLPGLLTLTLSMVLLMAIQFIGPRPLVVGTHGWRLMAPVAVIYVPWLVSLFAIGAIGAYLAGRAGASRSAMFLSVIFPVLPYLALFLIAFPVSLIVDDHVAHNVMLSALIMGLVAWVILPGAALLAGGIPTQLLLSRRSGSDQIASA